MELAGQRCIGNERDIQTGLAGVGVGMDLCCPVGGDEAGASWLLGLWSRKSGRGGGRSFPFFLFFLLVPQRNAGAAEHSGSATV